MSHSRRPFDRDDAALRYPEDVEEGLSSSDSSSPVDFTVFSDTEAMFGSPTPIRWVSQPMSLHRSKTDAAQTPPIDDRDTFASAFVQHFVNEYDHDTARECDLFASDRLGPLPNDEVTDELADNDPRHMALNRSGDHFFNLLMEAYVFVLGYQVGPGWRCRRCGDKPFSGRSKLKKHLKTHAPRAFACRHANCRPLVNDISQGHKTKKDTERHYIETHLPEELVHCQYCGHGVSRVRLDNLRIHEESCLRRRLQNS